MIGAGAHRVLGIMRGALAIPGVLDGGEIHLHDLDTNRARVMAAMLTRSPEFAGTGCRVSWEGTLEQALAGADIVGVIMPAGSIRAHIEGHEPSLRHGFISSDNLSLNGAMAAARIAPVIMDIARKMETWCPRALLVNFVNPVAVLAGMVNNHTRIRAVGVCQGFTNHLWDVSRIFGVDEQSKRVQAWAAGVNHLSYIVRGTWDGRDLLPEVAAALRRPDWRPGRLGSFWNEKSRASITVSMSRLARIWREYGVLVFSSEPDGMIHLFCDEAVEEARRDFAYATKAAIDREMARRAQVRTVENRSFEEMLNHTAEPGFWTASDRCLQRQDQDVFVRIFAAVSGVREERIATSRPNDGAIQGIKDRHIVEYTQVFSRDAIRHEGPYEIPDVVQGITAALAAHQTMLGDALAEEDPEMFARALMVYPTRPYSRPLKTLCRELLEINAPHIATSIRAAVEYIGVPTAEAVAASVA
jgi:alpha-galactosidase/6-phospho-beta-glucosidase family protein